jgi:hypothetical protein
MRKQIVAFHNFANVLKNMSFCLTVATHLKMSTSLKPPSCIFSPSAYIGRADIRYGFQQLIIFMVIL